MRLYLVRHGQTSWNVEQRAQGHTDIPLDEEGILQADMLGHSFAGVGIDRVLSSDLKRSVQTAEPIAKYSGARLDVDKRLRERSFGNWEGLPFDEFRHRSPSPERMEELFAFRPPGGESFKDVWVRLDPVVHELRRSEIDSVVVTHGGSCALLLAKLLDAPYPTSRAFRFGNAAVVDLELRPDGMYTMLRYNDTSHLRSQVLSGGVDGSHR